MRLDWRRVTGIAILAVGLFLVFLAYDSTLVMCVPPPGLSCHYDSVLVLVLGVVGVAVIVAGTVLLLWPRRSALK